MNKIIGIALLICFVLVRLPFNNGLTCYCDFCTNANKTCETDGICTASVQKKNDDQTVYTYQCIDKSKLIPEENPFMCLSGQKYLHRNVVVCCKSDMCNKDLHPTLAPAPADPIEPPPRWKTMLQVAAITACCVMFAALVCFAVCWYIRRQRMLCKNNSCYDFEAHQHSEKLLSTLPEATTSTSGSGLPLLQQRTIGNQVRIEGKVGQGRYGEVYVAVYQTDKVAVKVFLSSDEASFRRETDIYQSCMLRHENILGFIASTNIDVENMMQMWLITDYHEHGSLYDFLNRETIDRKLMIRLCLSAVTGLAHLHQDIVGNNSKVAIAHRDIKSKNILVKNNLQCCIADLGLAVKHDLEKDALDVPQTGERTGTVRYMAPEVLDMTINTRHFDSFKRADVYSMGLVLWEVAKRCSFNGITEPYQMPYEGMVSNNPKIDEMKQVVGVDKKRPPIPNKWLNDETMKVMSRLMRECWSPTPAARLTMLRVKKTLVSLVETEQAKV